MSPPGKELSGGLLNHRCLRVRMTQGLTTFKISYIFKKMTEIQMRQGMRSRKIDYLSSLQQKYLHTSSAEPIGGKYNGKAGYGYISTLLDPGTQVPVHQHHFANTNTKRKKHRACLRKSQLDLILGLLSMVICSLWTQPLLRAHILCPHRNINGSLQRTF